MNEPCPPTRADGRRRSSTVVSAIVVIAGIGLRLAFVNHPLDYRLLSRWRESDYAQIARNFYREGGSILYPRIDWRRDTPGYVEMEFPFLPWTASLLYRVFSHREALFRMLSAVLGSATLVIFWRLCARMLPPFGALVGTAAFAFSPQLVMLSSAMQPEAAMLFFLLVAASLIWAWEESARPLTLFAASVAAAAAILAKAPAAHIGLVFAYAVLRRRGTKAFSDVRVYAAATVALLPAVAWYAWAAQFWHQYGNSLGLSNESHFIGLDVLIPPTFLWRNWQIETRTVFTPAGWLLALAALRLPWREVERPAVWYGSVCVFYFLAARTSGDGWAWYYHSISVAPACLLMGAGAAALASSRVFGRRPSWPPGQERRIGVLLACVTIGTLTVATGLKLKNTHYASRDAHGGELYRCAKKFARYVPRGETIVAAGGRMVDERGRSLAHDRPMLFAWMDRRGFCYGDETLSIAKLDEIAQRGGRYWIVYRGELRAKGLRAQAEQRYRLVAKFGSTYSLYDLRGR